MASRRLLGRAALLVVVVCGLACGGQQTTRPGAISHPLWTVNNPEKQALANDMLPAVQACIGGPVVELEDFPIRSLPGAFYCGTVWSAGCFQYNQIVLAMPWYDDALWHELIHLLLYRQGKDWGHSSEAFARCDTRNARLQGGFQ